MAEQVRKLVGGAIRRVGCGTLTQLLEALAQVEDRAIFCPHPQPASPLAIELALFLEDVSRGGPTAAKGVMDGLRWLQTQIGHH